MDRETRELRRILRERDRLRAKMHENDVALRPALRAWSDTRPDRTPTPCGVATEAGARLLLRQGGLL